MFFDFVSADLEVRLPFVNVTNRHVGITGAYEISRERGYLCHIVHFNVQLTTDNLLYCTYVHGCICHINDWSVVLLVKLLNCLVEFISLKANSQ